MTLTEGQVQIILETPFGTADLDNVRHTLRQAPGKAAVDALLLLLMRSPVAEQIQISSMDIDEHLMVLRLRLRRGIFEPDLFRPLTDHFLSESEDDIALWKATVNFIYTVSVGSYSDSHARRSGSMKTSIEGLALANSLMESNSDQLDTSERSKVLEERLFQEIRLCTFRKVGCFFDKFFNYNNWSVVQKNMFSKSLIKHNGRRWVGFPDVPHESAVKAWIWSQQEGQGFLNGTQNKAQTTKDDHLFNRRTLQMDLYFLPMSAKKDAQIDFSEISVVGKLSCESPEESKGNFRAIILQLTRYVRSIFADQPLRSFVHAFTLCGSTMEAWVYDRSGLFSSGTFDIHAEPDKFARAMITYATAEDEALGWHSLVPRPSQTRTIQLLDPMDITKIKTFDVGEVIFQSSGVVCRGTTCYKVDNGVAKFAWVPTKRKPEVDHLRAAKQNGVSGVAELQGYLQLTSISDIRRGLVFPERHRYRDELNESMLSLKMQDKDRSDDELWQDRVFTCHVISPAGRVLSTFNNMIELLTAMLDAIKAHQSLYKKAHILHRDVSSNNIIITDAATTGGFSGMLIDLDLSKSVGSSASGAMQLIGTIPFVSIGVLRGMEPTYRHDLESFFWILIWMCGRTAWENGFCTRRKPNKESKLRLWEIGTVTDIAYAKESVISNDNFFDAVLAEFPESMSGIEPLCLELRSVLFGAPNRPSLDAPLEKSDEYYDLVIKAFEKTITSLR